MPSAPFLGMPFKWRWDIVRQRHSAVGGTKRLGIVAVWNRLQCINRQAGTLPRQFETSGNLWPIASQHQAWPNRISLNKCQKWPKNPAPQRQRLPPVVHPSRGISMFMSKTNKIMETHSFFRYTLEKWLSYFLRVHECLVKLSIWTLNEATTPQKWSSFISAWLKFPRVWVKSGYPKSFGWWMLHNDKNLRFSSDQPHGWLYATENICVYIHIYGTPPPEIYLRAFWYIVSTCIYIIYIYVHICIRVSYFLKMSCG